MQNLPRLKIADIRGGALLLDNEIVSTGGISDFWQRAALMISKGTLKLVNSRVNVTVRKTRGCFVRARFAKR